MSLEPVRISLRAAEEIKLILQSDEIPNDSGIRIGAKEGGCGTSGFTIGFDTKKEDDIEYVEHGLPVYINKKHVMYLIGKKIKYRDDGEEWGFEFVDEGDED